MLFDRNKLYNSADSFFEQGGSGVMLLTTDAAVAVCEGAADRGYIVLRFEGGNWRSSRFRPDHNCIWDSKVDPPIDRDGAVRSNLLAVECMREESVMHDVFIVSVAGLTDVLE